MEASILTDIGISIVAAAVLALAGRKIGVTPMVAYLAAGFLVGPHVLGWVTDARSIEAIAHLGLSLLLFLIGLEMDLKKMIRAGRLITVTGAVQILGGCVAAFALCWVLPFPNARETLEHAGIHHAAIIVYTLPDSILRGGNNRTLLRLLRQLNPTAQIIMPVELLSDVAALYAMGVDYVYLTRALEAEHVLEAIREADQGLLKERCVEQQNGLGEHHEVLP